MRGRVLRISRLDQRRSVAASGAPQPAPSVLPGEAVVGHPVPKVPVLLHRSLNEVESDLLKEGHEAGGRERPVHEILECLVFHNYLAAHKRTTVAPLIEYASTPWKPKCSSGYKAFVVNRLAC